MSRGNGRMKVFLDETDYKKFLRVLGDVLDLYDVACWDYCLMPTHYHLALVNRRSNLSIAMQHLNGEYATWWNGRHQRVGHVFQGRFKDQIVDQESYLLNLIRYIAMNPVRARLVDTPERWPWSAYGCLAGLVPTPNFLSSEELLCHLGDDDVSRLRQRYVAHVLQTMEGEAVYELFRSRRRILGSGEFVRTIRDKATYASPPVAMTATSMRTGLIAF